MRRKPLPAKPDPRPEWMVQQGNRCGCKGTDDMCPCQNEDQSQPQSRRDLAGEVRTLELQQQTDRQTIAGLLRARETAESRATAAVARVAVLEGALTDTSASLAAAISLLERSPKTAAPSDRMFDQMLQDYRASLGRARAAITQQEIKTDD